jgi:predicted branched-subunit amino acid permease
MSPDRRRQVWRDSLVLAGSTGAYGVSFGAVSMAAGLDLGQTCALSLLLFSGGSQFALVGVLGAGGSVGAGVLTALLLGARNAFYAIRLAPLLRVRGLRRLPTAQVVIDESTAMALAQPEPEAARLAFRVTGIGIYVLWNLATLLGALGADALGDPRRFGLDAAGPAAFVGLLAPRLRGKDPWLVVCGAVVVALGLAPFVPAGVPVLLAATVALAVGVRR